MKFDLRSLLLSLLAILLFANFSFSQQRELSDQAEISILTIGPGPLLNDAFGHNGIRVYDSTQGLDLVFNYGVYDFNAPNFYLNFARGKLNYKIGVDYHDQFVRFYKGQDRSIKEQILNLEIEDKQQIFDFLLTNYEPENRYYLYDFFYDNCATKMRDVLVEVLGDEVFFKTPEKLEPKTFRQLIHDHVSRNSWGGFGIDVALGSIIDTQAQPYEYMFLPEYIHQFFNAAELKSGTSLVKEDIMVYEKKEAFEDTAFILSPIFIMFLLALMVILISLKDLRTQKRTRLLDLGIFVLTGLIGIVLLLLWFATDHTATAFNYNLIWAFPLNILMLIQIMKIEFKPWFRRYIKFLLIILILMSLHWLVGVQIYPLPAIFILAGLTFRYWVLLKISSEKLPS